MSADNASTAGTGALGSGVFYRILTIDETLATAPCWADECHWHPDSETAFEWATGCSLNIVVAWRRSGCPMKRLRRAPDARVYDHRWGGPIFGRSTRLYDTFEEFMAVVVQAARQLPRGKRPLSQEKLAHKIGIDVATLRRYQVAYGFRRFSDLRKVIRSHQPEL